MMLFEDILVPQVILLPGFLFAFWRIGGWNPWVSGVVALPCGIITAFLWCLAKECLSHRKKKD